MVRKILANLFLPKGDEVELPEPLITVYFEPQDPVDPIAATLGLAIM
jgi:hypothetical protein